jgi:hypothetical protein
MVDMTYGSFAQADDAVEADCPYAVDQVPQVSLSIFADRLALRSELQQDALEAGLRIATSTHLGALVGAEPLALGDVILVDCPLIDAGVMAGLARLDQRAARIGAALVVSTSIDALDSVFACLDQSSPQILVGPGRAERLVALGRAVSSRGGHVAELSEADRLMLVRLAEQVNEIGARLERIRTAADARDAGWGAHPTVGEAGLMFRFDTARPGTDRLTASPPAAPALPDARVVRAVIRQRQLRNRFFPADMFADPAWDILLDLTAARGEGGNVSVSSLCIASGAAPTTALRWISLMTEAGLLRRENDTRDRRRAFIALTETAVDAMARYFAALAREALPVL